jgi:hypothetical protein
MSDFFSQYPLVNPLQEEKEEEKTSPTTAFFNKYSVSEPSSIVPSTPKTKSFFEKNIISSEVLPKNYSVTDLEKNREFMQRAERFLNGLESNENIFEFLRDSDYSLSSAIQRSFETGKWTEEQKQDYNYLKNKFAGAKLKGLKERLAFAKDFTVDMVADPLNILSVFFAIPTFGTSLGAKAVAGKLSQEALKGLTKSKIVTDTTTRSALLGAGEGGAWTGAYDYFSQRGDIGLGLREDIDYSQVFGSTALGAGLGGVLGAGIGVGSGYNYIHNVKKYANEGDILKHTDLISRKAITDQGKVELNFNEETPLALLRKILLTEKPTTGLARAADKLQVDESSKFSQFLAAIRYDYDYLLGRKKKKVVRGRDYNETYKHIWGTSITRLEKALNPLSKTSVMDNGLSQKANNDVLSVLVNPQATKNFFDNSKITPEAKAAATEIRAILDKHFDLGYKENLFLSFQKVLNYFPHKFNFTKLSQEKNKALLKEKIIRYKHAEILNDIPDKTKVKGYDPDGNLIEVIPEDALGTDLEVFGVDFLQLAKNKLGSDVGEDVIEKEAKILKADRIVEDILNQKYSPFEYGFANHGTGGYGFLKHRVFDNIPTEEMLPFIETDVRTIMQDYITASATAIARANKFGRTQQQFEKNFLKNDKNKTGIFYELTDAGVSQDEALKVIKEADKIHSVITGVSKKSIDNPALQALSDWGRLSQQMAHLPFATLSSITEPIVLFSKVDIEDVPMVVKELARATTKQTAKTIDRTLQGAKRVIGKETTELKDLNDEYWLEIYEATLALEQSTTQILEGLTGGALQNPTAKNLQNLFFQMNALQPFTSATQAAAFNVGKLISIKNLGRLDKHLKGIKKLNKRKLEYVTNQLNELGIDEQEGIKFYRRHLKDTTEPSVLDNNTLDVKQKFNHDSAFEDTFYKDKIIFGAERFANEIVMDTRLSAANTPTIFSSPMGQILFQFAKYPAAFNNTILKDFFNKALRYPEISSPRVLGTVLLMTAVATLGNAVRSEGRSLDKPTGEVIADSWRRWGGFGPLDYVSRWQSNLETGGGLLGATYKAPFGPLPADVIDTILYRQGPGEVVMKNIPGYSALPQDVRQELKRIGRDIDKYAMNLAKGDTTARPIAFTKGGLVEGPKVRNTKEDPAEALNPRTGLTYEGKTPVEQQMDDLLEERTGFANGGEYDSKNIIDDLSKQFMNAKEQRNFEADAAESLNKLVNEQRLPEEYKLTITGDKNKVRYVEGSNDPFNELKHYNLGIKYGNSAIGTTLINAREIGQILTQGRFFDSVKDIQNNIKGVNLLKQAKGNPEEAYKLAIQEIEKKYKQQDRKGFAVGALAKNVLRLFHGSQRNFKNFDNSFSSPGEIGKGLYFSPDKKIAKKFSKSADWRKYTNLTEQQRIEKRTDPTPTIYEVEVKISPDELLDAKKSLKEQNPIVRNKILTLVSEKLKDKDILDIEFSKPKFWRQILKKLKTEADELFPSYGIKGIFREDKKGSAFSVASGNKQYSIFDTDIIKIIDKKEI